MKYFGLVRQKHTWKLTWRSWLLLAASFALVLYLAVLYIPAFLSLTAPVKADILVVEGWLPDFALESAVQEFRSGGYRLIVTSGGPLQKGYYLSGYKTSANLAAAVIRKLGVPEDRVVAVSSPFSRLDRTHAAALAVKEWLIRTRQPSRAVNVFSMGPHARRSFYIFTQAFSDEYRVGIIATPDLQYNWNNWWRSSHGVRFVLSETIAYCYALFFFVPAESATIESQPAGVPEFSPENQSQSVSQNSMSVN